MSKKSIIPKLSKVYKEKFIAGRGDDKLFREYLLLKEKIPTGLHNSIVAEVRQYLNLPLAMKMFDEINKYMNNVNYHFVNDTKTNKKNTVEFTTVYNDLNVLPPNWYQNGLCSVKCVQQEALWINKFLFQRMIDKIIWEGKLDSATEFVKLRILVSKLQKLPIDFDARVEWEFWIKDLYWARKRAVIDFYLSNVIELPF